MVSEILEIATGFNPSMNDSMKGGAIFQYKM